jgi:hypothetical protein
MLEDCGETQDNRHHLKDDDMNSNIVIKLTAETTLTQVRRYATSMEEEQAGIYQSTPTSVSLSRPSSQHHIYNTGICRQTTKL